MFDTLDIFFYTIFYYQFVTKLKYKWMTYHKLFPCQRAGFEDVSVHFPATFNFTMINIKLYLDSQL